MSNTPTFELVNLCYRCKALYNMDVEATTTRQGYHICKHCQVDLTISALLERELYRYINNNMPSNKAWDYAKDHPSLDVQKWQKTLEEMGPRVPLAIE